MHVEVLFLLVDLCFSYLFIHEIETLKAVIKAVIKYVIKAVIKSFIEAVIKAGINMYIYIIYYIYTFIINRLLLFNDRIFILQLCDQFII